MVVHAQTTEECTCVCMCRYVCIRTVNFEILEGRKYNFGLGRLYTRLVEHLLYIFTLERSEKNLQLENQPTNQSVKQSIHKPLNLFDIIALLPLYPILENSITKTGL